MTNQLMPGNVPAARPPPSAGADAIARWFGPDIYGGSRRLPNMPGQRVMTVDEIECSVTAGPPSAANWCPLCVLLSLILLAFSFLTGKPEADDVDLRLKSASDERTTDSIRLVGCCSSVLSHARWWIHCLCKYHHIICSFSLHAAFTCGGGCVAYCCENLFSRCTCGQFCCCRAIRCLRPTKLTNKLNENSFCRGSTVTALERWNCRFNPRLSWAVAVGGNCPFRGGLNSSGACPALRSVGLVLG